MLFFIFKSEMLLNINIVEVFKFYQICLFYSIFKFGVIYRTPFRLFINNRTIYEDDDEHTSLNQFLHKILNKIMVKVRFT